MMKQNLLVVDWDYFFPVPHPDSREAFWLYDWQMVERELNRVALWQPRACTFMQNGVELPSMNDEWRSFWDRFPNIHEDAVLYYADSNGAAALEDVQFSYAEYGTKQVWLYDAHHDCGYRGDLNEVIKRGSWSCEDWMCIYHLHGAGLHVRYPRWKPWAVDLELNPIVPVDRRVDDDAVNKTVFHAIFVCRSAAWVPPWNDHDNDFLKFVQAAPVDEVIELDEGGGCEPRPFSMDAVAEELTIIRRLLDQPQHQEGDDDAP